MENRPWPPNWKNKNEYPDPDTTAPRMWAWEYLRRKSGYQKLCNEIGLEWFENYREQVKQISGLTDDKFKEIINSGKETKFIIDSELKTKLHKPLLLINSEKLHNPLYKEICKEFKILTADHYSINYPITIFETDIGCIRKTNNKRIIKNPYKLIINNPDANRVRPAIFLSLLQDGYKKFSEICGDNKFTRDPLGKVHLNYLRIHDACNPPQGHTKPEDEEISQIIYGSEKKLSAVGKSQIKAIEYIDGRKYLALAAPIYKK